MKEERPAAEDGGGQDEYADGGSGEGRIDAQTAAAVKGKRKKVTERGGRG